jgi:hypothetical protein
VANTNSVIDLDLEWLSLIIEAKELGISKESVRNFLNQREVSESLNRE